MVDEKDPKDKIEGEVLINALMFWKKVYDSKEATIKFVKKNGEVRIMRCTLDFTKIPKKDVPKQVNVPAMLKLVREKQIIHVYDLDRQGWRSIPFSEVEWLENKQGRFYTKKALELLRKKK
jgi:hypothetical protein